MANARTANEVLDREFLEIRAKILELAASFDRIDRAEGNVDSDPRMLQIFESIKALGNKPIEDRAAAVQMIYSLPYEETWRSNYKI